MLASRRYYATVSSSIIHLDQFLASLIIFGLVIAAALVAPTISNPQTPLIPGAEHGIHLTKIAFILSCSALSFLVISFVLSVHALAELNSKLARESAWRKQRGYADVVLEGPNLSWLMGVLTCVLGIAFIFGAVAMSIASALNEHNFSFIACVSILGVGVVVGCVLAFMLLFNRNETAAYGAGNTFANQYTASPIQYTGSPAQYAGTPTQFTGSPVVNPAP